jgi:hypothetical protein
VGLALTPEMILVLGLVGFTMLMLVLEWIRADMVALLVVVVIGLTGLIPSDRVFNGFAGNAVIAIIAIMIMGEGLDRAGVLGLTARFVMRMARGVESRLGLVINMVASLFSAVIPSQALAALMIPGQQPPVRTHRRADVATAAADGVLHSHRHQHHADRQLAADRAERPDRQRQRQPAARRAYNPEVRPLQRDPGGPRAGRHSACCISISSAASCCRATRTNG